MARYDASLKDKREVRGKDKSADARAAGARAVHAS